MIYLKGNRELEDHRQCDGCLRMTFVQEIRYMEDVSNRRISRLCDDCLGELFKALKTWGAEDIAPRKPPTMDIRCHHVHCARPMPHEHHIQGPAENTQVSTKGRE